MKIRDAEEVPMSMEVCGGDMSASIRFLPELPEDRPERGQHEHFFDP